LLYGFVSAAKIYKKSNITKEKEMNSVLCFKARGYFGERNRYEKKHPPL
jgi:hypothetical protein